MSNRASVSRSRLSLVGEILLTSSVGIAPSLWVGSVSPDSVRHGFLLAVVLVVPLELLRQAGGLARLRSTLTSVTERLTENPVINGLKQDLADLRLALAARPAGSFGLVDQEKVGRREGPVLGGNSLQELLLRWDTFAAEMTKPLHGLTYALEQLRLDLTVQRKSLEFELSHPLYELRDALAELRVELPAQLAAALRSVDQAEEDRRKGFIIGQGTLEAFGAELKAHTSLLQRLIEQIGDHATLLEAVLVAPPAPTESVSRYEKVPARVVPASRAAAARTASKRPTAAHAPAIPGLARAAPAPVPTVVRSSAEGQSAEGLASRAEEGVSTPVPYPDVEEMSELMTIAGNSTRLKLLYLLENMKELSVTDLAEQLGTSVSAVNQHLYKLKAYGLVAPRRDAQTIYYRLTDHAFNAKLRENFFRQFQV
jgi:DNA-binding transcriptional ArsR family regulator